MLTTDESVLGDPRCLQKWMTPIRNWRLALNRFMIMFEDRLTEY
ncbi:IS256 family transposase, partial [Vibrio anguillarum]|nr:IS256 family transposase [Vibrio anguillarum]